MCKLVKDYYVNIFSHPAAVHEEREDANDAVIADDQNKLVAVDFLMEEFSVAIKQMHKMALTRPFFKASESWWVRKCSSVVQDG